MNKRILFLLAFLISSISLLAENPIDLGIKVGVNKLDFSTNLEDYTDKNFYIKNDLNYTAGAFLRINLGSFYLQPEALFGTKNSEIDVQDIDNIINEFDLQTLSVPVLLGFKLISNEDFNLRMNAGPVFNFVNDGSFVDMPSFSDLSIENMKKYYYGWQAGIGLDAWFLTFDVRAEGSGNMVSKLDQGYLIQYTTFTFALGIKIF